MSRKILSKIKLVLAISKRFSSQDRTSRSSLTARLAIAGICFGVMTLIVVMSVMNGFQMSFINAIQEISSYHFQIEKLPPEKEALLQNFCDSRKEIKIAVPFYQAQTLMCSVSQEDKKNSAVYESPAIIRGLPSNVFYDDEGFRNELYLVSGSLDLSERGSIVLGNQLAANLHVRTGDRVNLFVLSGSSDVDLFSGQRIFVVKGIVASGYQDINSSLSFINIEDAKAYFGKGAEKIWGIKLENISEVEKEIRLLKKQQGLEDCVAKSWKEFNKSFYGALRIEKNMLLLVVCLIFIVVAINIYNGMRRLVFERKREIAILCALGAEPKTVRAVFIMRGLYTGLIGSTLGLVLGLLISFNTDAVFNAASKIVYFLQYIFTAVFSHENLMYVRENSAYALYASIPARIFPGETILIFAYGIIAPLAACFFASRNVLKLSLTEVLHEE